MEERLDNVTDLFMPHFSGEGTPEQEDYLQKWLSESEEHQVLFREYREIWISASVGISAAESDSESAFGKFRSECLKKESRPVRHFAWVWRLSAVAAVVVLVMLLSFNLGQNKMTESFADIVIESPLGSRTKVVLPDSTEVWLNSGSRISYSQGFGVKDRNVELSGEGHFSVKKNPSKPFSVNTDELELTVLGTVFNFKNYKNDTEAIVTLEEGRVALKNRISGAEDSYLSPNHCYILDKSTGKDKVINIKPEHSSLWVSGRLFFDEELLSDIAKELERCYNVVIAIENQELANSRFYGDFSQKELSIDEILEAFSNTGRIHGKREGKKVLLY